MGLAAIAQKAIHQCIRILKEEKPIEIHTPIKFPIFIGQGFHGNASHHFFIEEGKRFENSYSLDFLAREGTRVYPALPGEIVAVKTDGTFSYNPPKNPEDADSALVKKADEHTNHIIIRHDNGLKSWYVHLCQHDPVVQVGQHVHLDTLLGYTGNTGASTQPHLHFSFLAPKGLFYFTRTVPFKIIGYTGSLEDKHINKKEVQAAYDKSGD